MNEARWRQRYENYERALSLLREGREKPVDAFSDLEKEGLIQRFAFTFELAWKTMKDFLEYNGVEITPVTPRHVIKEAYGAGIIQEGQVWIDMLDHRNTMAHLYEKKRFEAALDAILHRYLPVLDQLAGFLNEQTTQP